MILRFITPNMHGVLDYLLGGVLIVAPFLLGLGASSMAAVWLSVILGVALVVMSLLTDYRYSAAQIIPFRVHFGADMVVAFILVLAPFVFSFSGHGWVYYVVAAAAVLTVMTHGLIEHPRPCEVDPN